MPDFVEFSRGAHASGGAEPMFTLQARGLLSLNQGAFDALGAPVAVALLYDVAAHIVGVRNVDPSNENAYAVRKQKNANSYVVGVQAFTAHHGIPTPRARRFTGVDYGDGIIGFALDQGALVQNRRGAPDPGTASTESWRHTFDATEVTSVMRISDRTFSHPGYSQSDVRRPAAMRIGVAIACDPLGPTPASSELRSRFLGLLTSQPILDLVSRMTTIAPGAMWRPLAGHGRLQLEAAMMTENQQQTPVASAMLFLPDTSRQRYGDARWAELVLHIEPRSPGGSSAPPEPLRVWEDRFRRALDVPPRLAHFLNDELNLTTPAEPASQLAVWLSSEDDLTDLVDINGLKSLPGATRSRWFHGYAVGDPEGSPNGETARALVTQMCEYSLHLDGWESALDF